LATIAVNQHQETRHSAAARLDRLPIGSFQKRIMWLVAYIYFFELGDLNNFGFVAPELRVQWGLSISIIGVITASAFIGMFVGAISGGWISDRIGRKKALVLTTIFFSIFSLLNAFAWNVPGLLVTRFLTGVGLSSMTVVAITYITEMFPASKRGAYQAWVMVIGLFGIPLSALVAGELIPRATYGWRFVFGFGALALFMPLFSSMLEESPRWYETQGRNSEADAVLDRVEARCKADSGLKDLPPLGPETAAAGQHQKFSDLFSHTYLSRTLMLIAVFVFQTLGLFGFMAWVPTLLATRGFPVVKSLLWVCIMYFGAPVGALIAVVISDRWERKYLIAITAVVIAGFGVMYGLSSRMVSIIVLGFCVAMFIQTFAPLLYAYTPECYPTEIRNSGSGISYGAGRLANGFGPMLIAFLFTHYGYKSVFVYIAVTWLLVAIIITIFGPKTKGMSLA
jgi:putative MFS transporter